MEKGRYEAIKAIKTKVLKGEKTTFAERNIANIYDKNMNAKKKRELRSSPK